MVALMPHSKMLGPITSLGPFSEEFACCLCVFVSSLQVLRFPYIVQKHACDDHLKLKIVRYKYIFFLCGSGLATFLGCQTAFALRGLQQTPGTLSSGTSGMEKGWIVFHFSGIASQKPEKEIGG